jgi:putative DNA primase/helicase
LSTTEEQRSKKWKIATQVARQLEHKDVRTIEDGILRAAEEPGRESKRGVPRARRAADIEIEKVCWLWEKRIPRGMLTILEGEEGIGKGTLLCALAAAITTGKGLADMVLDGPGNVLWFAAEDTAGAVLKPRWLDAKADVTRIYVDDEAFVFDQRGISQVRAECELHHPVLIIIDPIFSYTKGNPSEGHVARELTNELKAIATQYNSAIILVRHVGKSKGLGDPRAAGLYSIEWRAAARSVLLAGCDPDNKQRRGLFHTKHNQSAQAEPIGYDIQPDAAALSGAKFYWTGHTDLTPREILSSPQSTKSEESEEKNSRADAEDFLMAVLSEAPATFEDIEAEARNAGISIATLRRAKDSLGVKARKSGFGKSGLWYWCLPEHIGVKLPAPPPKDTQPPSKDDHTQEIDHLKVTPNNKGTYVNGLPKDAQSAMCDHLSAKGDHLWEATPEQGGECETCPVCDNWVGQSGVCDWCEERAAIEEEDFQS